MLRDHHGAHQAVIKEDNAHVSFSGVCPSLIVTGCKRRCRHVLFFSGATEQPWTRGFHFIALSHSKRALLILPLMKKNLNGAELAVVKQILDDRHLPTITPTGLHRQIYYFTNVGPLGFCLLPLFVDL